MINTSYAKIALLAGLIAAGGVAAQAKTGDHGKSGDRLQMFEQIDADGNGAVTPEEMRAHAAARFAAADADGDGFLSVDEMRNARGGKRAQKMLEKHDTNGDGTLDAAELEAAGGKRHAKRAAKMLERVDTDKDGKVSLAEMTERRDPAKMFERLDANADGALSADEFAKARHGGKRKAD